jgi:hypothetical protein
MLLIVYICLLGHTAFFFFYGAPAHFGPWPPLYTYRQLVGLLGQVSNPSQGRYLHRTTQTQNKRRQTSMPLAGFERTIPVFKRWKRFYALDRAAPVTGGYTILHFRIDARDEQNFSIGCFML